MKKLTHVLSVVVVLQLWSIAASAQPLEVHEYRAQKIGVGSFLVKSINHFRTPHVMTIDLDAAEVTRLLPDALEPRLDRPIEKAMDRITKFFTSYAFIGKMHRVVRNVEIPSGIETKQQLKEYFTDFETHTYAITGEEIAFAKTGVGFGKDLTSKHAVIAADFLDVRYAGQMWRDGDKLCINANSGTFVKKRKSNDLVPAPDFKAVIELLTPIFAPVLQVTECREISPWFGADEAIDQAEKGLSAASDADEFAELETTSAKGKEDAKKYAAKAREMADLAYEASEAAAEALWEYNQDWENPEARANFFALDLKAAEAAATVKKARKKIEKLLEAKDKPE